MKFGNCEIICIQDAQMRPPQSLFSDTAKTGHKQTANAYEGSLNVFLVHQDGKSFLIDAGNDPARGSLRDKLVKLGVSAESITDIFITHIHPDHVGGLLWEGKKLFPNAVVHIAKDELDAWKKDARRSGLAKYLAPYEKMMDEFAYDKPLPFGLVPLKRSGHTPGHTIYRLALADGQDAIFVGDIAHAASLQFPYPTFCAQYDAAPAEAVQARILTLQMKGILFGAHFPFPGAVQGGVIVNGAPNWSFTFRKYK